MGSIYFDSDDVAIFMVFIFGLDLSNNCTAFIFAQDGLELQNWFIIALSSLLHLGKGYWTVQRTLPQALPFLFRCSVLLLVPPYFCLLLFEVNPDHSENYKCIHMHVCLSCSCNSPKQRGLCDVLANIQSDI